MIIYLLIRKSKSQNVDSFANREKRFKANPSISQDFNLINQIKTNLVINTKNNDNITTNTVQPRKIVLKRSHLNEVLAGSSQSEMNGDDLADQIKKSKLN